MGLLVVRMLVLYNTIPGFVYVFVSGKFQWKSNLSSVLPVCLQLILCISKIRLKEQLAWILPNKITMYKIKCVCISTSFVIYVSYFVRSKIIMQRRLSWKIEGEKRNIAVKAKLSKMELILKHWRTRDKMKESLSVDRSVCEPVNFSSVCFHSLVFSDQNGGYYRSISNVRFRVLITRNHAAFLSIIIRCFPQTSKYHIVFNRSTLNDSFILSLVLQCFNISSIFDNFALTAMFLFSEYRR
jgi:hypothetical protein